MEFLIQREDGLPFALQQSDYLEVLRPASFSCRVVPGWGAHRIEVKGCPILFAFDEAGITVSFQNWLLSDDEVIRVVNELAASVARSIGAPTKVVES